MGAVLKARRVGFRDERESARDRRSEVFGLEVWEPVVRPLDGIWSFYGIVLVVYSGNKGMSSIHTGRHTQDLPAKSPHGLSPQIHNLVHGLLDHVQRAWAPEEEAKAWKNDPHSCV